MRLLVVDHNAVDASEQAVYRQLAAGGINVRVLIPRRWFDNYRMRRGAPVPPQGDFEACTLPVVLPTRTHRMMYGGLRTQMREFRPDILYVNSEPENFAAAQCARIAAGHPETALVFSTWRNIDHHVEGYPYRLQVLHRAAERYVLRRARHGIAFSGEAPGLFAAKGFAAVTHIPPAVDTDLFKPAVVRPGGPARTFTVGYAGRIHKLKGLDVLLNATALLPPDMRLLVVGAGAELRSMERLCRSLGLERRVEFRAPVPRSAMPGVLAEMDVLVLPSRTGRTWKEQFGRILAEAMACGVPVIGSDSGEIPSVVDGAGLVVPEGDARALSAAIVTLHGDALARNQFIDRGLERVLRAYSVHALVPRYRELFEKLSVPPHALEL